MLIVESLSDVVQEQLDQIDRELALYDMLPEPEDVIEEEDGEID